MIRRLTFVDLFDCGDTLYRNRSVTSADRHDCKTLRFQWHGLPFE